MKILNNYGKLITVNIRNQTERTMTMKIFGKGIEPDCEYCAKGTLLCDENGVVCEKYGYIKRRFGCKKLVYHPLKRTPKSADFAPDFDASDFSIE